MACGYWVYGSNVIRSRSGAGHVHFPWQLMNVALQYSLTEAGLIIICSKSSSCSMPRCSRVSHVSYISSDVLAIRLSPRAEREVPRAQHDALDPADVVARLLDLVLGLVPAGAGAVEREAADEVAGAGEREGADVVFEEVDDGLYVCELVALGDGGVGEGADGGGEGGELCGG